MKPCPKKPYTGGRQVCTPRQWKARRFELLDRAEGCCEKCGSETPSYINDAGELVLLGHAHHINETRGLGGGKRDDRMSNLLWLCGTCHDQTHEVIRTRGLPRTESTIH